MVEAQKGSSENEGDKSKMVVVVLGLVASHSKLSQGGRKQSNIRRAIQVKIPRWQGIFKATQLLLVQGTIFSSVRPSNSLISDP